MRTPANHCRGFSLVELIVATVTLGVALTAVAVVIYPAVEQSAEPAVQIRAAELGQAYLDEILTKRFDENTSQGGVPPCQPADPLRPCTAGAAFGADAGEDRTRYDDVDDYHGLDEQPPVDAEGQARDGYGRYRVQVQVSHAGNELGLAAEDAKRVDVVVTSPLGDRFPFSAYRVNF